MGASVNSLILILIGLNYNGIVGSVNIALPLQTTLNQHGVAHVMIVLHGDVKDLILSVNTRKFSDPHVKAATLVRELRQFTDNSQRNVLSFLRRREPVGNVKPFWITNKISVRNATSQMIKEIIVAHGDEIVEIREAVKIVLDDPMEEVQGSFEGMPSMPEMPASSNAHLRAANTGNWGISNINIPQAHQSGSLGQGVVVAIVDTGVRHTHETLRHNMRPTYNWFDTRNHTLSPIDVNGHGTHCAGTILGRNGIGVSPLSQWVGCRIFDKGDAEEDVILLCAQWITCPTLADGTEEDCSMRPHVVSNSWGGGHNDFFNDPAMTWNAAGIIPVFGNDGPACRTASSPGDQEGVISVGATNIHNGLAGFSGRGPSGHVGKPRQKPEVSAPGMKIMSASHKSDTRYAVLSGTSMATPHVAGVVALLLSKKPDATFDEILYVLQATASRNVHLNPGEAQFPCIEGLHDNVNASWPNNLFGAGIVQADAALDLIGTLRGNRV